MDDVETISCLKWLSKTQYFNIAHFHILWWIKRREKDG